MATKKEENVHTISESDMQLLAMIKAGNDNKNKKSSGLGFMWSNTTESVGEVFGTVAIAAKASRVFAESGLDQALQAKADSGQELLEKYGIQATGLEAVTTAKQLRNLLLSL